MGYQHADEANTRIITYPVEVTMDYITRMEVVEAIGDFGQLATGMSTRETHRKRHLPALVNLQLGGS